MGLESGIRCRIGDLANTGTPVNIPSSVISILRPGFPDDVLILLKYAELAPKWTAIAADLWHSRK
jgi:hypothetical protein